MKYSANLRTTTATAALVLALGSPAVFGAPVSAQATADTILGSGETISKSATYTSGNYQVLSATPTATTTNNNVNLSLTADDAINDIVTVAAPQTNNLISATAIGNSSTALGQLLYSPNNAGETAAVGTLQAVQADVLADSTDDTHSIVIENAGDGVRTLTGTTLSDNNDITASAIGNTATSTITAASGLDLVEAIAGQSTFNIDGTLASKVDNDVSGDLIVSSSQEIDAAEAASDLTVTGLVDGAFTSTLVEDLDVATVTLSNNDQASTATGNSAASSISSLDTTASITASTAVSNLQVISAGTFAVDIDATTQGSEIAVSSGIDSNGNNVGDVVDSIISVRDNTQSATATGSVSTQSIALDASSITGEGIAADTGAGSKNELEAAGDSIIGNVQSIDEDVKVSGSVSGNTITSVVAYDNVDHDVTTSTIELTGNTQAAAATGVSTSNTLSLTSGATMNAAGVVASVQAVDGTVLAETVESGISNVNHEDNDLTNSTLRTVDNTVSSTATGTRAVNLLESTTGTNNLDVAINTGVVNNSIENLSTMPRVTAGQALLNDQSMASSAVVSSTTDGTRILTETGLNADSSTVATDGNVMSASATASEANNSVSLAFNELVGTISDTVGGTVTVDGTGVVAAVANEQTLDDDMSVTARTIGYEGEPIRSYTNSDAIASRVSTSANIVSAAANGNVTSANNVIVDATNVTSGSLAAPVMTTLGASTATGSFVAASTQISGADILASQLNPAGSRSNTIMTEFADDIRGESTVVSDDNVLSAVAKANSANNAVQLGDDQSATVAASGVVANYQGTLAAGSVTSQIGIEGTDSVAAYGSSNSGNAGGTMTFVSGPGGDEVTNTDTNPLTLTFISALTPEEASILNSSGYTAVAGTNTATLAPGATGNVSIFNSTFGTGGGGAGNQTLTIVGFSASGTPVALSGAGVLVKVDGGNAGEILASTVSVSGNTVVGAVTGNTANNAVSATATSVTGLAATAVSVDVGDTALVNPTGADLATANLQESAAPLTSDVYAVFGIIADDAEDGDMETILNSTQMVSDNLQQSYATANSATNKVDVTATNASAETALDSVQASTASVSTDSGMQVVANAGSTTSSLEMDGNTNQSVANGNVVNNVTTADVTNANVVDGAVNASADLTGAGLVVAANNVVSSAQSATANVTATAETDVFNQDNLSPNVEEIVGSDVSMSSNSTIAQATANSTTASGNILTLGNDGTANMNQTGLVANLQNNSDSTTTVLASVAQDISLALTGDGSGSPVDTSSLSLDGNSSTALARSNVATNALIVDGANINAGSGGAVFDEGNSLAASYVLGSLQDNAAGVTATTTQSRVVVEMSNDGFSGGGVLDSTVSLSGNDSSATALANTATNSVSVGANAANVDASTALANTQFNGGAVAATGGSEVGLEVFTGATGLLPVGIDVSTVMVSENVSSSNAAGNQAQNTLTVAGANIVSGATNTLAEIDSSGGADDNQASAGNLLLNSQENEGLITSTNTANLVGINVDGAEGTIIAPGAAVSGSTLGVTGNVTEARATANLVLNSSIDIGGAGTSSLDSTAAIGNFQVNDSAGTVKASASTTTGISLTAAGDATGLDAGTAMVQGNSTLALARGNVAENILNANGSNVTSGTSPATLNSGTGPATGVLNASFGVLNEQQQRASVTAESLNTSYKVEVTAGPRNDATLGLALNGASATVSGNTVNASAFGNVATNRVNLASLTGATNNASAAVYNTQLSTGAITSKVSGASVGVYSVGGVVNAAVGVSNNSISATSIGNFATSSFTRSDY
jgi:hypothetical protein